MDKQRMICLIVCGLLLLSLFGCGSPHAQTETIPSGGDAIGSTQSTGEHVHLKEKVYFDSMDEIKSFFVDTGNSLQDSKNVGQYYSLADASVVSNAVNTVLFPVADTTDIGARFVVETKYLDIAYMVDQVQYRFFYTLDDGYELDVAIEPVVQDAQVGPYKVDFARRDHAKYDDQFYGYVDMNGICVEIWVTGDGMDRPSFEVFNFVPISSIGNDTVG